MSMGSELAALHAQLKELLVENLMLQVGPGEIGDEQPLFGPASLGLDSVDALQLVVALEKQYGFKIPDAAVAREVLGSVATMAAAITRHRGGGEAGRPDHQETGTATT